MNRSINKHSMSLKSELRKVHNPEFDTLELPPLRLKKGFSLNWYFLRKKSCFIAYLCYKHNFTLYAGVRFSNWPHPRHPSHYGCFRLFEAAWALLPVAFSEPLSPRAAGRGQRNINFQRVRRTESGGPETLLSRRHRTELLSGGHKTAKAEWCFILRVNPTF